jgi:hypothetical protein
MLPQFRVYDLSQLEWLAPNVQAGSTPVLFVSCKVGRYSEQDKNQLPPDAQRWLWIDGDRLVTVSGLFAQMVIVLPTNRTHECLYPLRGSSPFTLSAAIAKELPLSSIFSMHMLESLPHHYHSPLPFSRTVNA